MYFDTHAHYDDEAFDGDRGTLLSAMEENHVTLILNPGCNRESSVAAMALAAEFPFVYAAVGWHPHNADEFDGQAPADLRQWAALPKVRAIGEIGLDYHYDHAPRERQRAVLIRQMELARETGLPVVIHDREAHGDMLEIIRGFPDVRGVFHCYSGSAEMARLLLDRGFYIGFTGVVTVRNARRALEAAAACPMDRILIETDAPYMAPVPHRGKRSDSSMLPLVAQALGAVKGLSAAEVARAAMENGKRLFGIA